MSDSATPWHRAAIVCAPQMRMIAIEIVKQLGYYTKVADWNRKEYLKAKIRTALQTVLMKAVDGRANYNEVKSLSSEVMKHAETVYVLQQDDRERALTLPTSSIGLST